MRRSIKKTKNEDFICTGIKEKYTLVNDVRHPRTHFTDVMEISSKLTSEISTNSCLTAIISPSKTLSIDE